MMCTYEYSTSALYFADRTQEITEHANGSYSTWVSKVNVKNGVLQDCFARSHFKHGALTST